MQSTMLEDDVYIVTGAGHGIGKATAKELAWQGATVVVNDLGVGLHGDGRSEDPAQAVVDDIEDEGSTATTHFGDVSSVDYTAELVADTVDTYGRIDGVANFAGILRDKLLSNMTPEEWDPVIDVHLRGHYALLHSVANYWREHADTSDRQRSFLSVSSEAAFGNPGQANYAAAKAGVLGLTRTAARELEGENVRVNAMMPRAYTRMVESIPEAHRPDEDEFPDSDEIAPMVTYLLSDAAADITGCTVLMTGDQFGLVTDPQITRTAHSDSAWSAAEIAETFRDAFDGEDLTNTYQRI